MKTKSLISIVIIAFLLSSCLVRSLHPFYKESDVIFKKELLGKYLDKDTVTWVIQQNKISKGFGEKDTLLNSYEFKFKEKNKEEMIFKVHLFGLNGNLYLDFFPVLDLKSQSDWLIFHITPSHSLAKLEILKNKEIKIKWFNEEWLKKLFQQNRIKIAHEVIKNPDEKDESYILTASTNDLQKFLIKYGNDPQAFKSNWEGKTENKEEEAFTILLKKIE